MKLSVTFLMILASYGCQNLLTVVTGQGAKNLIEHNYGEVNYQQNSYQAFPYPSRFSGHEVHPSFEEAEPFGPTNSYSVQKMNILTLAFLM